MLAAGALAGAGVAVVAPGLLWLQIVAAVVVSVAMLGLLRPTLLRRVRSMPGLPLLAGQDGRVGSGLAMTEITSIGGEIKVAGEVWTARSLDGSVIWPAPRWRSTRSTARSPWSTRSRALP